MKIKAILTIFLSICWVSFSFTQILTHQDSISRTNADNVVKEVFGESIKKTKYILISIQSSIYPDYLVVYDCGKEYKEYYITKGKTENYFIKFDSIIIKPNTLFEDMFKIEQYSKNFISFHSDFYKNGYERSHGNLVYFVLKDGQDRYGESLLSIIIEPNPINPNFYNYLLNRLAMFQN